MRTGDVIADIKQKCPPEKHDLGTAEGWANWDDELRAELDKIEDDPSLRRHAARFIKDWRYSWMRPLSPNAMREIESFDENDY